MVLSSYATSPPNDNFYNSIAITSSPTVVTAVMAEATWEEYTIAEDGREFIEWTVRNWLPSLWWSLDVTNVCSVTVEMEQHIPHDTGSQRIEALWPHTNGNWSFVHYIDSAEAFTEKTPFVTVAVSCPTNLMFRALGETSAVMVLRFTIHSAPWFIRHPQNRTVSPGGSVLFG